MAEDNRKPAVGESRGLADQPTYSEDGVDLTLIRWMLSLTPAERLQVLQQNVRSILRLRGEETET
jgi:hypothetical protein